MTRPLYEVQTCNPTKIKGRLLYQVEALKDFSFIKKGELGGHVEKDSNLSQEGDCWVFPRATAVNDCEISGDALVSGRATISGNAKVREKASVHGNAQIQRDARVEGYSEVRGDAIVSGTVKDSTIVEGNCNIGPLSVILDVARLSGRIHTEGLSRISGTQP